MHGRRDKYYTQYARPVYFITRWLFMLLPRTRWRRWIAQPEIHQSSVQQPRCSIQDETALPAILAAHRTDYFSLERYSKWCMEFVPSWMFQYPRLNDLILRWSLLRSPTVYTQRNTKSLAIPSESANSLTNSEIILPGWKFHSQIYIHLTPGKLHKSAVYFSK